MVTKNIIKTLFCVFYKKINITIQHHHRHCRHLCMKMLDRVLGSVGHWPIFADAHWMRIEFIIWIRRQVDSPCSCGHFEMRLTYVGLSVTKLNII